MTIYKTYMYIKNSSGCSCCYNALLLITVNTEKGKCQLPAATIIRQIFANHCWKSRSDLDWLQDGHPQ